MVDEDKSNIIVEEVNLVQGSHNAQFSFYAGKFSSIPVADIGDVFANLLGATKSIVVGDTDDTFTIFLTKGNAHTLVLTFTQASFGDPPPDAPPAHRGQFNRYHVVLIDFQNLKQVNVPFTVPSELVYKHNRGMWGIKHNGNEAWDSPKEEVYDSIRYFVEPVVKWLEVVGSQF